MMLIEDGLESAQDKAASSHSCSTWCQHWSSRKMQPFTNSNVMCLLKVDIVSHSPAAPALWLALIVVIFAALLLGFIGIYCIFTLRLSSRQGLSRGLTWTIHALLHFWHFSFHINNAHMCTAQSALPRPIKEVKRPALRAVLHALAMDSPAPDRRLDAEVPHIHMS